MDNSPLQRISPELRNQIYELALTSANGITIDCRGVKDFRSANVGLSTKAKASSPAIALTQTCQEIRRDSLKMYYFLNTFTILTMATHGYDVKFPAWEVRANLNAYRRMIGKDQFSEIRKVTLIQEGPPEERYKWRWNDYFLDRKMLRDIRGTFSSLPYFEVRFEMKQQSNALDVHCLNVMWDMDQSIEQLQARLLAAEKESNETFLGVRRISILIDTMSRMVSDLVEFEDAEGEWIGDEVEGSV